MAATLPLESFLEQKLKNRHLRTQVVFTGLVSLIYAFDIGVVYLALHGEGRVIYGGSTLVLSLSYTLVPFIIWISLTFSFFAIARFFGAHSEFGVLARGTGWGMLPMIPGTAALVIGRHLALSTRDFCEYPATVCKEDEIVDIVKQVDHLFGYAQSASNADPFRIGVAIFCICFLLATYIFFVSVDKSSNLTKLGTVVSVLVPSLAALAYFLVITL